MNANQGYPKTFPYIYLHSKERNTVSNPKKLHSFYIFSIHFPYCEILLFQWFPDIPFSFVIGQSDQFPLKPNPESLYGAMETVGADRSEVIYVGDSEVDYELSENAGVKGIIVDYGFRTRKELEAKGISGTLSSVEALKEEIFRNFLKN